MAFALGILGVLLLLVAWALGLSTANHFGHGDRFGGWVGVTITAVVALGAIALIWQAFA